MATEKPRFTITLDDDTFDRVAQFQADEEYATRSKAIQNLVLRGLDCVRDLPNVRPVPGTKSVPRLGAIACGEPILAEQNIDGYDQVPNNIKCDFTLLCKGDSMIGARIYNGDLAYIRAQPSVENGQIAAVYIDGGEHEGATLKRVRYVHDGIVLMPENSDFEPMIFTGDDVEKVHILGLATHFTSAIK